MAEHENIIFGLDYVFSGCQIYRSATIAVPKGSTLISYRISSQPESGGLVLPLVDMSFAGQSLLNKFASVEPEEIANAFSRGFNEGKRVERKRIRKLLKGGAE